MGISDDLFGCLKTVSFTSELGAGILSFLSLIAMLGVDFEKYLILVLFNLNEISPPFSGFLHASTE